MNIKFDGNEYTLDPDELTIAQAMVIKLKTGFAIRPWQKALEDSDPDALKALYWLMLAQNGIRSDIDKIDFKVVPFIEAFAEAQAAENAEEKPVPTMPAQNDSLQTT